MGELVQNSRISPWNYFQCYSMISTINISNSLPQVRGVPAFFFLCLLLQKQDSYSVSMIIGSQLESIYSSSSYPLVALRISLKRMNVQKLSSNCVIKLENSQECSSFLFYTAVAVLEQSTLILQLYVQIVAFQSFFLQSLSHATAKWHNKPISTVAMQGNMQECTAQSIHTK